MGSEYVVDQRRVTLTPVPARPPTAEDKPVDEHIFFEVLGETCRALEEDNIINGVMGGIASAALGRPRWTHDVDLFVRTQDKERALVCLSRRGFSTEETNPNWIFKAWKDGVLIDLIFRAKGEIYLDDDMESRIVRTSVKGCPIRTIPAEDLVVIKAIIHEEDTPRHWFDAIGVITRMNSSFDWEYLLKRAGSSPRRVLSLLSYAQSTDVVVPDWVITRLVGSIYVS